VSTDAYEEPRARAIELMIQSLRPGEAAGSPGPATAEALDFARSFAGNVESASDGMVISDRATGVMLDCNAAFAEITGYDRADLIGRSSLDLGLVEGGVRSDAVTRLREQRPGRIFHTRMRRADGEVRILEFTSQLFASRDILFSVVRDITDRRSPPMRA
jgi:PAS domain S-box-containing protein